MGGERTRTTFQQLLDCGALEIGDGYRAENSELGGNGPIFLRAGHVTDSHIDFAGVDRFDEKLAERVRSKMSVVGDTIVTTKGNSTGRTAFVTDRMPRFVYSPHLSYWRSRDSDRLCGGFLRYWSRGTEFSSQLSGMKTSTDMAPYLSLTDQRRLAISLPSGAEQRSIAFILGALDDKIELNRRMNGTLEAMARALFQSWFVDFDPVRAKLDGRTPAALDADIAALFPSAFQESHLGQIPAGWEIGSILRQADLLSGGTPKTDVPAYWNGGVPWASAKDVSQCGDAFLVCTERTISTRGVDESSTKLIPALATVVVARGATAGRLTMLGYEMAMNQTCYGLRSKLDAPFALYCNTRNFIDRLVQGGHGSVFDTITTGTFEATPVLLPPAPVQQSFDAHVSVLFERVRANLLESRTLAALRDTLLPKLLSGELRVSALESTPAGTDAESATVRTRKPAP